MASFAPIRGTRNEILNTPIVDGQFLLETDQGANNKIYTDNGNTRVPVGGNSVNGSTGSIITVTAQESELYGQTVTITQGATTLTETFDASGKAVFNSVTLIGALTISCTYQSETISTILNISYFSIVVLNIIKTRWRN